MKTRCHPPKAAKLHRFEPSVAFPIKCECGYYFRSHAQKEDHRDAWRRVA